MSECLDLTHQVFGRLTVIRNEQGSKWVCRCACGKTFVAFGQALSAGRVNSCGCQPPVPIKRFPRNSVSLAQRIVALLIKTPLLTSHQLADSLGLFYLSLVGVMSHLSSKGILEQVNPSGHRQVSRWKAIVTVDAVPGFFGKVGKPHQNTHQDSHQMKDIGITEEDKKWMQHYRAQWLNRYQRMGQQPPISKFD